MPKRKKCPNGQKWSKPLSDCVDKDREVQEIAGHYSKFFERRKRNDEQIVILKDEAPEELKDMVREAHGEMMPDDYKYKFIEDAIDSISESDDPEDEAFERIDASVDVYTNKLNEWLGSRTDRYSYVDEAVQELGHGDGIIQDIQRGQFREREEVYHSVLNSLKKLADED